MTSFSGTVNNDGEIPGIDSSLRIQPSMFESASVSKSSDSDMLDVISFESVSEKTKITRQEIIPWGSSQKTVRLPLDERKYKQILKLR